MRPQSLFHALLFTLFFPVFFSQAEDFASLVEAVSMRVEHPLPSVDRQMAVVMALHARLGARSLLRQVLALLVYEALRY